MSVILMGRSEPSFLRPRCGESVPPLRMVMTDDPSIYVRSSFVMVGRPNAPVRGLHGYQKTSKHTRSSSCNHWCCSAHQIQRRISIPVIPIHPASHKKATGASICPCFSTIQLIRNNWREKSRLRAAKTSGRMPWCLSRFWGGSCFVSQPMFLQHHQASWCIHRE